MYELSVLTNQLQVFSKGVVEARESINTGFQKRFESKSMEEFSLVFSSVWETRRGG